MLHQRFQKDKYMVKRFIGNKGVYEKEIIPEKQGCDYFIISHI